MGWFANQKARNEAKKSGVPLPEGHPARDVLDKSDAYFDRKRAEAVERAERRKTSD